VHGWAGLDPTNSMLIANDHIVLAKGRDYAAFPPSPELSSARGSRMSMYKSMSCGECDPRHRLRQEAPAAIFVILRAC